MTLYGLHPRDPFPLAAHQQFLPRGEACVALNDLELTVAQIAQRRAQVRRLIAVGMTAAETAKALGVKPATVSSDLRAMRVGITELRHGTPA